MEMNSKINYVLDVMYTSIIIVYAYKFLIGSSEFDILWEDL